MYFIIHDIDSFWCLEHQMLRSGIIFSYEHPSKLAFRSDFARLIKLNKNVTLLILMLAAKRSIMY